MPRHWRGVSFIAMSLLMSALGFASDSIRLKEGQRKVELTPQWCGAKGLHLIAQGFGLRADLEDIMDRCDPQKTSGGVLNLITLQRVAQSLGMEARPVRCELDWLKNQDVSALTVHWRNAKDRDNPAAVMHCLVFLEYRNSRFYMVDPLLPDIVRELNDEEFSRYWTGEALLVAPSSAQMPVTSGTFPIVLLLVCNGIVLVAVVLLRRRNSRTVMASLVLGGLLCGCGGPVPSGDREASTSKSDEDPGLQFDRTQFTIDAPVLVESMRTSVSQVFPFVNSSSRPVKIRRVAVNCSCTAARFPRDEIEPGEHGEITLTATGHEKTGWTPIAGRVELEGSATMQTLHFSVFFLRLPQIVPNVMQFGDVIAGETQTIRSEVVVHLKPKEAIPEVKLVDSDRSFQSRVMGSRLERRDDGNQYARFAIESTCTPNEAGKKVAARLKTEVADRPAVWTDVHAEIVHPDFEVDPRVVSFGRLGETPVRSKVIVRARQSHPLPKTFHLQEASGKVHVRGWCDEQATTEKEAVLWLEASAGEGNVESGDMLITSGEGDTLPYHLHYVGFRATTP